MKPRLLLSGRQSHRAPTDPTEAYPLRSRCDPEPLRSEVTTSAEPLSSASQTCARALRLTIEPDVRHHCPRRSKYAAPGFQLTGCSSVPTAGFKALHIMPSPA